jgi:hypothetical protein
MAARAAAILVAPRFRDDKFLLHRSCRVVSRSLATNHAIQSVADVIITTTRPPLPATCFVPAVLSIRSRCAPQILLRAWKILTACSARSFCLRAAPLDAVRVHGAHHTRFHFDQRHSTSISPARPCSTATCWWTFPWHRARESLIILAATGSCVQSEGRERRRAESGSHGGGGEDRRATSFATTHHESAPGSVRIGFAAAFARCDHHEQSRRVER